MPSATGVTSGQQVRVPSPFTTELLTVEVVFLALATVVVVVRVEAARKSPPSFGRSGWWTSDLILIIASLIVTYGLILATIIGAAVVGLNHINDPSGLVSASEFTFKTYFADVILSTAASGLCKISILEFYKRIFVMRWFQILCNIVIFLVSAWIIGTFFTQIFSTTPVSAAWHPNLEYKDADYNYPTALLAIFGIGIVLDVLVLCLPIRPITQLQLRWQNKLKVGLVLWLGVFCVICTAVRFYYSYKQLKVVFMATEEQKGTITIDAAMWSQMEPSASIVAASLPTLGPVFNRHTLGSMIGGARSFFSLCARGRSVNDSIIEKRASKDHANVTVISEVQVHSSQASIREESKV